MAKNLTVQELAKILEEEFDRDEWGDIDPYLFGHTVDPDDPDDNDEDAEALRKVLERVVDRLNKR